MVEWEWDEDAKDDLNNVKLIRKLNIVVPPSVYCSCYNNNLHQFLLFLGGGVVWLFFLVGFSLAIKNFDILLRLTRWKNLTFVFVIFTNKSSFCFIFLTEVFIIACFLFFLDSL